MDWIKKVPANQYDPEKLGYRLYVLLWDTSRNLSRVFLRDSGARIRKRTAESSQAKVQRDCEQIRDIILYLRDKPRSSQDLQDAFSSMVGWIVKGQWTRPNKITPELVQYYVDELLEIETSPDEFKLISRMLERIWHDQEALETYLVKHISQKNTQEK